jgi:hypothetical protein
MRSDVVGERRGILDYGCTILFRDRLWTIIICRLISSTLRSRQLLGPALRES